MTIPQLIELAENRLRYYQQQLLVYHSIGDIDHINKFQALADETALTITKLKTL